MSKSHRDNTAARKKRGAVAFEKKAERRAPDKKPQCRICGQKARPKTMVDGICANCRGRQVT